MAWMAARSSIGAIPAKPQLQRNEASFIAQRDRVRC